MANVQITQLPNANPLVGNEQVPIVQSGITVKTTTGAIAAAYGPLLSADFVLVNYDPTLPNSRYLSSTLPIRVTDNGAGSPIVVSIDNSGVTPGSYTNANITVNSKGFITSASNGSDNIGITLINTGPGLLGGPITSTGTIIIDDSVVATLTDTQTLTNKTISGSSNTLTNIGNASLLNNTVTYNGVTIPLGGSGTIYNINAFSLTPGNGLTGGAYNGSAAITFAIDTSIVTTLTGTQTLTNKTISGANNTLTSIGNASLTNSSVTYNGVTVALGSSGTISAASPFSLSTGTGLTGGPYDGSSAVTITIDSTVATVTGSQSFTNKTINASLNTLSNIGNSSLTNSAITINGTSISLGGTDTITATVANPLTIGTGLSGTSFNGSTAVTIAIDSTVVTLTGNQTLTNKSISGATNTLSAIPNVALDNSSITINGSPVSLGSSITITASIDTLTIGTGLTGTSYNGTAPVTIAIDTAVVATTNNSITLTNKAISGSTNTLSNIGNSSLTNSSVTINGSSVSLGGSITVTATATNALTIGTGLTGTSYNGSSAVTVAIDSTVVTLTGIQTLTNKSISGSDNTLSNIGNSSLTNSSVTFNGSTVSLGGSATITAVNPNALTIGTGLTGTSYTGSSAVTIAIDSTVVTLTGTQTLTNKTLTTPVISSITNTGTITLPTSTTTLVGTNTSDTLTNKSISGSTNTLTNIGNASLTNSSVTIGSTNIALGATASTLSGLTTVTVTQDPTTALQLATKQYVDGLVSSGIHFHEPVRVEAPTNLNATYNQPGGAGDGVGATLTNAGTQAALVIDGVTLSVNDRVLIYLQTTQTQNGVYVVTSVGSVSTNWILTRSADTDTYGLTSSTTLGEGSTFFVQQGTTGAGTSYTCNTSGVIVFGTTNITFAEISSTQIYSAGTGLTLTGTQFSITNTSVTPATYGSASSVPVIAVNAQGQITSATDTSIAIAASQITSGTIAVNQGGTGAVTLTGYVKGNGTSAFTASATVPTSDLSGTISNGQLANSSITINGSSVSLGSSVTVTATATNALTIGTGLSGTSYNGSGAVTIAIDSTVATLTGAQTLTNKSISGSTNTLSNIANASLTNSSITVNGNSVSLGASTTVTANTTNAATFNNSGSGDASGTTFDGSAARTISYNTLGAPKADGTGASGTWGINISGNAATATSATSATSATTATNLAGGAANSVPYQTGAGATSFIGVGSNGQVLTVVAGVPAWSTPGAVSAVTTFSAGTTGFTPNTATSGAVTLSGTLNVSNGGTGATTLTGILYGNGTSAFTIATGSDIVTAIGVTAVTNATNATNATNTTNTGITNDTSTNATVYPTWVTANTGNLPQKVTSTKLTFNPSTGVLTSTGGISGGSF